MRKVSGRLVAALAACWGAGACGDASPDTSPAPSGGGGGRSGSAGSSSGGAPMGSAGTSGASGGTSTTGGQGGVGGSGGEATAGAAGSSGGGGTGGNTGGPLPPALTWVREGSVRIIDGIWGSGPSDVYAVGRSGSLLHSTGDGTWTLQTTDTTANLTGIWGSGPGDVYVSANANLVLHSTGNGEWESRLYDVGFTFQGIWGLSETSIFLVGPGVVPVGPSGFGVAQEVSEAAPTTALWGSSATDLYVTVGGAAASVIYHSTGDGTWQPQDAPTTETANAIWGIDAARIYVGAGNDILVSTGNGQWLSQLTTPGVQQVNALWAASPEAVYACTQGAFLYRSNGQGAWSEGQQIDPAPGISCFGIWGTGPENIYVATSGGVYHGTP